MPGGRPTKYKPEFASQAEKLCQLGATDVEIADFFEITVRTVYRWKADYEEFCQALKAGKVQADDRVERSLFQKAVGYTFESEKVFQHQGEIVRTPVREHVPPSDTAAIFWLKNRRADEWRDAKQFDGTINHRHEQVSNDADAFYGRIASLATREDEGKGTSKPH